LYRREEGNLVRSNKRAIVEERNVAVREQNGPQPQSHLRNDLIELVASYEVCRPRKLAAVDEITEYLAVVRRRSLVVPAIPKHLRPCRVYETVQRTAAQKTVVEEDTQAQEGLEVLDEMIPGHVTL